MYRARPCGHDRRRRSEAEAGATGRHTTWNRRAGGRRRAWTNLRANLSLWSGSTYLRPQGAHRRRGGRPTDPDKPDGLRGVYAVFTRCLGGGAAPFRVPFRLCAARSLTLRCRGGAHLGSRRYPRLYFSSSTHRVPPACHNVHCRAAAGSSLRRSRGSAEQTGGRAYSAPPARTHTRARRRCYVVNAARLRGWRGGSGRPPAAEGITAR